MADDYIVQLFEDYAADRKYKFSPQSKAAFLAEFSRLHVLVALPLERRLALFELVFNELDRMKNIPQGQRPGQTIRLHEPDVPAAAKRVSDNFIAHGFLGFDAVAQSVIRDSCPWC